MKWSALKSKTIWFGIAQLAGSLAVAAFNGGLTEAAVITFVTGVTTIILRALTDTPLADK